MITQDDLHQLVKSLDVQDRRADDLTLRMEDLESLVLFQHYLHGTRLAVGIDVSTVADGDGHLAGNLTVGDGTGGKYLFIDGAAGEQRHIEIMSGGLGRWRLITSGAAESGSNVGSDFIIQSRKDDGTYLANTLKIVRSTGEATFSKNLTVGDGTGGRLLTLDGAAGQVRDFYFKSGGSSRWTIRVDGATESGSEAGSNFVIIARYDNGSFKSSPLKIWRATGSIQLGGDDIYTVPWTNYSGSSNIIGWASFTTKVIEYKKIGKLVFVNYYIIGTSGGSDGTKATFTLPFTHGQAGVPSFNMAKARNNGANLNGKGWGRMLGNVATFYINESEGSWIASGSKVLIGQFQYEAA